MSAIIANNLVKHYKSGKEIISAVRGVSLRVEKGELFGIIGPDGAGKTSLFRMLTTLLLPDDGNAMVDGSDVVKDYKSIRKKSRLYARPFFFIPGFDRRRKPAIFCYHFQYNHTREL